MQVQMKHFALCTAFLTASAVAQVVYTPSTPSTAAQGAYLGWNSLTGGTGEADLINNEGGGSGGFAFMNTPNAGTPKTTLMFLNGSGNLGIGTTQPETPLQVVGTGWVLSLGEASNSSGHQLILGINNSGNGYGQIQSVYQGVGYTPLVFNALGGNVGIGLTTPGAKLEVNGNVKLSSGSGASITFADSTVQSTAWTGSLCGGDYAESVDVSGDRTHYEPGDVLVIDPQHPGQFLKSNAPYSRLVAGIYSTKPGLLGRRQTTDPKLSTTEVPMAMVGIVPTKVTAGNGPIEAGDLLVSSSLPAHAMRGSGSAMRRGTVIGKALGSLSSGTGVIEVLVTLQ